MSIVSKNWFILLSAGFVFFVVLGCQKDVEEVDGSIDSTTVQLSMSGIESVSLGLCVDAIKIYPTNPDKPILEIDVNVSELSTVGGTLSLGTLRNIPAGTYYMAELMLGGHCIGGAGVRIVNSLGYFREPEAVLRFRGLQSVSGEHWWVLDLDSIGVTLESVSDSREIRSTLNAMEGVLRMLGQ